MADRYRTTDRGHGMDDMDGMAADTEVRHLLEMARDHLDMDVAFVGRFANGERHVDVVAAPSSRDRDLLAGASAPEEETYCARIADGRLLAVTPDTSAVGELAELAVTDELRIGAYLGVTIMGQDGTPYGTVCAYSHGPSYALDDRDADVLRFVAGVIQRRLHGQREHREHRRHARSAVELLIARGLPDIVLQPIVRLADRSIEGFEALARFPGSNPASAFAAAHACGLGTELELQAIGNALALLPVVRSDLSISINVGLTCILDDRFVGLLDDLPASRVRWELTEHEAEEAGADELVDRLALLRERGFTIAMDDVGAGWSGLERLLRLAPETIKLDRSLVSGVDTDPARRAMLGATGAFASEVGASIVAEGIETELERDAVHLLGIAFGQGYGLGRPASVLDLQPELLAAA